MEEPFPEMIVILCNPPVIWAGTDRQGMQRGLTLEGKESQAKVGTLLMRNRYSSVRLIVYS